MRRAFHEFPLVAEMRHSSWMHDEALGTLIDYHIGFANIDQAAYTKAMPPTSLLTSPIGYVRLHGRNPQDWQREFGRAHQTGRRARLPVFARRTARVEAAHRGNAASTPRITFVFANNDVGGKAVVNALQFAEMLGDDRRVAPADLIRQFPSELSEFHSSRPVQGALFPAAIPMRRAVA